MYKTVTLFYLKKDLFLVRGWYLLIFSDTIIFLLLLPYCNERKVNKIGMKRIQKKVYKSKVYPQYYLVA